MDHPELHKIEREVRVIEIKAENRFGRLRSEIALWAPTFAALIGIAICVYEIAKLSAGQII